MKKVITIVTLILLLAAGMFFGKTVTQKLLASLWPTGEDPLPTLKVQKRNYVVAVSAEGELTGLQTIPITAPQVRWFGSLKVSYVVPEGAIVQKDDVMLRFDRSDANTQLEQNQNTVDSYDHKISKASLDTGSNARILNFDKQAADLEVSFSQKLVREDTDIFSRWEIQESVMNAALARYKKEVLDRKGRIRQNQSAAEMSILNIEQRQAQMKVQNAEETLASLEVKAPILGVVLHERGWMSKLDVGSEAWPGQPLMEIASLHQFQGRMNVTESDITGVEVGKRVQAVLNAMPELSITGKISKVSRVAETLSDNDPKKYFSCEVIWEVSPELLSRLKPGMKFRAVVEANRYNEAVVLPKNAVFKTDNQFHVFVKGGPKGFSSRAVTIADSDYGFYVVQGLNSNEEISLRHPFEKQELHLPDFNSAISNQRGMRTIMVF